MLTINPTIATHQLLLVSLVFLVKHFLADFLLQTTWMALGKERAAGWVMPLAVHAGIHAIATGLICVVFAPALIWFAAVDFVLHFAIDRSKAIAGRFLQINPSRPAFWWLLGLDQTLHHATHLGFTVVIASQPTI